MNTNSSEEEMRAALFGVGNGNPQKHTQRSPRSPANAESKYLGAKIRVALHVRNEYEGAFEVVSYESSSLSWLVVEMDARKKYKKKYKYTEVVSVERI
ncbi:hypothetical protein [Pseudomonas sp. JS425]|uniref:hypothetical protein n=1 Tax=Pseudomonas sp. JS425 TaxID=2829498 RepID=UPI001BB04815|nr:hypothetical protein [Pseudomonas sp. JS425]QUN66338.1 hypothetical protein KDB76_21010 [Pseudomonas sp. JS425]